MANAASAREDSPSGNYRLGPKPTSTTIRVAHGDLRAHAFGNERDPLVVCVHGLSANSRSFDPLAQSLARSGRYVVAVDLRGRGHSTTSAPGTYGWKNHALDVIAVARALGFARFDVVGHSMGAFIGLQLAALQHGRDPVSGPRMDRLVLVDAVGFPEPAVMPPILGSIERLTRRHPSIDAYVAAVRAIGNVDPWSEDWERSYRYEVAFDREGAHARTSHAAVLEDATYGSTQDPRSFWPSLRAPSLLVRAARALRGGLVVSTSERDRFLSEVPSARAVDVDANHYGVLMHADTFEAIGRFLS